MEKTLECQRTPKSVVKVLLLRVRIYKRGLIRGFDVQGPVDEGTIEVDSHVTYKI